MQTRQLLDAMTDGWLQAVCNVPRLMRWPPQCVVGDSNVDDRAALWTTQSKHGIIRRITFPGRDFRVRTKAVWIRFVLQ